MPRTPLALVPLGEKDKEDVLLRYYINVHSMLTMFVIINIPDVHITRPGPSIYKHFKDY